MAEIADGIISGEICEVCCSPLQDGPLGHPARCDDCVSFPHEKQARVDRAEQQHDLAAAVASDNGLTLRRCDRYHWQLLKPGEWELNLYPSNGRIYSPPKKRGPYLHLSPDWTLLEAVHAAIAKDNEQ
jgi:hypothetical protein